jgi:phosphoglycolate phosphatase
MRLVLFDCDGTLADSQNSIVRAMDQAFNAVALPPPGRARTLSIVGLSLPQAIHTLAPDQPTDVLVRIAEGYRAAAQRIRLAEAEDPLYAGADTAVRDLAARADVVLGMATGKSMKGVHRLIAHHRWDGFFSTLQTADNNPSKPHPGMIQQALRETGTEAAQAVMIGDTTYDMEMARAAGVRAIAVTWGYHPVGDLKAAGAHDVVETFDALLKLLADDGA